MLRPAVFAAAMFLSTSALLAQAPRAPSPSTSMVRLRAENDSLRRVIDSLRGRGKASPLTPPRSARRLVVPDTPSGSHPGTIKVEFDRFRNVTVATLSDLTAGKFGLTVLYTMEGQNPQPPEQVTLLFSATSHDSWQYLRCHDLALLIDGQPFTVESSDHDGRVGSGYVLEFITAQVSAEGFLRMAAAHTGVEGKICNTEFRLDSAEILAFQDLASRMK